MSQRNLALLGLEGVAQQRPRPLCPAANAPAGGKGREDGRWPVSTGEWFLTKEKRDEMRLADQNCSFNEPGRSGADSPRASPSGKWIAFEEFQVLAPGSISSAIFLMELASSDGGQLTLLSRDAHDQPTDWKDIKVLFQRTAPAASPNHAEIWVVNQNSSDKTKVSGDADQNGTFSPDLKRIAFMRGSPVLGGDIWVENADGTGAQRLTNDNTGNFWPDWSN